MFMKKEQCPYDHQTLITKHCVYCGALANLQVKINPNCKAHHGEYKKWKHNFCPDCGQKLRK